MGSKLYVGNLSYNTTSADLEQLCAAHGTVQSAEVIQDRDTNRSKGFGFVQMGSDEEAKAAIAALNGQEQDGRALTVNVAKPREDRPRGGGLRPRTRVRRSRQSLREEVGRQGHVRLWLEWPAREADRARRAVLPVCRCEQELRRPSREVRQV